MRWLALCLVAATAYADDGVRREMIAVGQAIERDVGYAIGVMCDHDVVAAEMTTRDDRNYVVFRGQRAGKTTCRVGTDPNRVSFVFEITVVPKRPVPRGS
jgi:hypothetical protein